MWRLASILPLALIASIAVRAADSTLVKPDHPDTVLYVPIPDSSASVQVTNAVNFEGRLTQNPTAALFKSMFVPGLGQLGNRRYVKAAAVVGLQVWFVSSAIHYGSQASDLKAEFNSTPLSDKDTRNFWHAKYEEKAKARNKYIWFAGITTFVSMFDAYVDAHLSGAPTAHRNEKLSFDFTSPTGDGVGATLAYRF
ncbi:MAG: DUF5683 domain-containing protein [Candidatus Zixiibacteriota bacterium]